VLKVLNGTKKRKKKDGRMVTEGSKKLLWKSFPRGERINAHMVQQKVCVTGEKLQTRTQWLTSEGLNLK